MASDGVHCVVDVFVAQLPSIGEAALAGSEKLSVQSDLGSEHGAHKVLTRRNHAAR
jgi:hypothetical protein